MLTKKIITHMTETDTDYTYWSSTAKEERNSKRRVSMIRNIMGKRKLSAYVYKASHYKAKY